METTPGRRERNKQLTRRKIRRTAMQLFEQSGFEQVTTVDVAQAAGVSPATVFNYFATKEDLFFGQVEDLECRLVELVTGVEPGESILTALQEHVLWELTAGRAYTDPPAVTSFHGMLAASPSLRAREAEIYERRAVVLTGVLVDVGLDALLAHVVARQFIAAEQLVAAELRRRLARSNAPSRVLRAMPDYVEQVFELLRNGIGDLTAQ